MYHIYNLIKRNRGQSHFFANRIINCSHIRGDQAIKKALVAEFHSLIDKASILHETKMDSKEENKNIGILEQ